MDTKTEKRAKEANLAGIRQAEDSLQMIANPNQKKTKRQKAVSKRAKETSPRQEVL